MNLWRIKLFQTSSPTGYPTYPLPFMETSIFVSAFKRILNFRSLPTNVCSSKKPGFSLGSFTLPRFSVVWFVSVLRYGVDKIFHQREKRASGRTNLVSAGGDPFIQHYSWVVLLSSHPFTPCSSNSSFANRFPWYKILQNQLPRMKSIGTGPLLLNIFLFDGAH